METIISKSSKFASLFQKNGLVFVDEIWHYKAVNQYSMIQKIQLTLFTNFLETKLLETPIYGESFRKVPRFAFLS